jgi:uncharacterized membrane protein
MDEEQSATTEFHISPTHRGEILPPPVQWEKYILTNPDAVKTILEMAMNQQQMDFEMRKVQQERFASIDRANFDLANKQVDTNGRFAIQGQCLAFVMMLCFFVLLGYMAAVTTSGAVAVGFIVPAITAIGHIVYLFLHGKKTKSSE